MRPREGSWPKLFFVTIATAAPASSPRTPHNRVIPPAPRTYTWGKADWISTGIIAVLALITRFVGLTAPVSQGTPVFDEKHYVPQAWDMVKSWDNLFIGGIETNPGFGLVVHPPLGKQIIAISEWVFGYTPLGWRLMTALFGVATVLMTMALARRLSFSWQVATFAGILAVCDGVLLVSAKFGMLDIFQVFFIVAAAWALARDHQQMRERLHNALLSDGMGTSPFGPRFGFRWWRFTAGVFLGLSLAVKWSGLYYIMFFGLLCVFSDLALRRKYGVRRYIVGTLIRDTPAALASLVAVPVMIYVWSWRAWFASETAVYRHAKVDGTIGEDSWLMHLPESVAGWFYYHLSVLDFHASLTSSGGHHHPWDSKPWAWLAGARPILYYSSTDLECSGGGECRKMLYLFGTPAIWWLVVPAVLWGMWSLIIRRNRAFLIPLVGFAAGFLPWLAAFDRQMYFFYATAFIPFVIVLLALILGQMVGRGKPIKWQWITRIAGGPMRRGTFAAACYLALVVAMFFYFAPILYGFIIPESWYQSMMWLPSWK
ncbi:MULTISPECIES: phospholipid carrier-dependent glycosyltransferase [unclassified Corynebacterium]|uniref:dolichyl-phosphate-mannose--protein mannosyltransferase n=1 Tax=unclassified Corynebacterium TaxID=2624378 RepID=UPI001EF5D591|nr:MULTISPECIES: phospholipid carrier-dependent glycosyltransferase [unclassified Corynebacterium]MCG7243078.1 phospholipid carrier-dependent glycosyltransferase [Corynebacterium sp. ACRPS]MCG7271667.1 phospholipid carrier-dependent glycosyltransferase [Corynebacterium sp. ACRQM]MCG7233874.1 phospholipid carrier-dependent glycosyltransferase [Corynebacterium sp. ACRPR]MDK8473989.1 phospholipid carrier-dependent glycosyltransferase [Corynebacterium sp. MSK078]MDK8659104.1 phospholipid carrier-d